MPFNFLNQGQTDDTATRVSPIDTFIDPVSKIRVSNPANLIDTDFEYGLQPTKWETVEIINNTPAFFSKSGDTTISDITGITTNGGTREITVTTAFPHNLDVGIPIRVSGTKSLTADGSYIINATPTPTTFTYLARANQPATISIFDLYSSIITGEFFQGSQISISDSEGMTTDGSGPNSTLTIKTSNKHGFGPKTPFYFLNINSTVSQEFESQNSTSLSFDPTNSATAQAFDGSNTLLQTPVDLSNKATESIYENSITSTNPTNKTITVSIVAEDSENWSALSYGDPLYYDVNVGSGYFQANPRGVVFIKNIDGIDAVNNTATFQVSSIPDDTAIDILANMTGYFQIANQARTFAGNNVDEQTQIEFQVEVGSEFVFDGGNRGYDGELENPPSNQATVVGYTGTSMTVFTNEGTLDYYVGAMLKYETDDTAADGLVNGATYFVTAFSAGASAGLFNMSIAELPGGSDINISGGSGTQTFSKIGVSVDKDIVHVKDSNFEIDDMVEYTYPNDGSAGNFGADFEQKFYFIDTAYDAHNYKLSDDVGFRPIIATGGDIVTETFFNGQIWKVHQFTTPGTSTFNVTQSGNSDGNVIQYLIIGGGGGGGSHYGGGGGAGGYRSSVPGEQSGGGASAEATTSVSTGSYEVVVGAGGSGSAVSDPGAQGSDGENSSFNGIVAIGGGGGGNNNLGGRNGGSGGGAGGNGTASGGLGQAGQGFDGGDGRGSAAGSGGGGGAGGAAPDSGAPNGGPGLPSSITGSLVRRAGGGEGWNGSGSASDGGGQYGSSGQANTGGGGGGRDGANTGNGGSGIVVLRYPITEYDPNTIQASGGTVTTFEEDNTIYAVHTFDERDTVSDFTITSMPEQEVYGYGAVTSAEVIVEMWGSGAPGGSGGAGGFSSGRISLDLNETLKVEVGGPTKKGINYSTPANHAGQRSAIWKTAENNEIMVAGGGGGRGQDGVPGAGGGVNGQDAGDGSFSRGGGFPNYSPNPPSGGGTQSGGGRPGTPSPGWGGHHGTGVAGTRIGKDPQGKTSPRWAQGKAGGSGYYSGGSGGATAYAGISGGGGSGYLSGEVINGQTITGNRQTPANESHPLRGSYGSPNNGGAVIIRYPIGVVGEE